MPASHDTANEIWKPIPMTNGFYEASSLGRIRRAERVTFVGGKLWKKEPAKICKQSALRFSKKTRGQETHYHRVSIHVARPRYPTVTAHILVADAFHGPRPPHKFVNHKDGNKGNSHPDNLEYVTRRQNQIHALTVLGKQAARKLSDDDAVRICEIYARGGIRMTDLGKQFNIDHRTISLLVRGESRTWLKRPIICKNRRVLSPEILAQIMEEWDIGFMNPSHIAKKFGITRAHLSFVVKSQSRKLT